MGSANAGVRAGRTRESQAGLISALTSCSFAVLYCYQADLIGQAVGGDRIAIWRHVHVADDVPATRYRPALEFFGCRIETHDGVRLGSGLVVPDRALGEDDAVRLRISRRPWRNSPARQRVRRLAVEEPRSPGSPPAAHASGRRAACRRVITRRLATPRLPRRPPAWWRRARYRSWSRRPAPPP